MMRFSIFFLAILSLLSFQITSDTSQLVIVIVPHEDANQGKLYKFEKSEGSWNQIGPKHDISVGANGVAWARSDLMPSNSNIKKEGDKRSPAGIFPLYQTFGRTNPIHTQYLTMPYEQIGPNSQCIEDKNSAFYNQIVFDNSKVAADWVQDDRMLRDDELYDWGIFVDHNSSKTPGEGSCIFIHIWSGEGKPTAGCTAMSKRNITQLVYWLDATKNPHMVLLTEAEYDRLKASLDFPNLN